MLYVNCLYESQQVVYKMIDLVKMFYKDIISANDVYKVIDVDEIIYNLFALFTKWKGCWDCLQCDWCCLQRIILVEIVCNVIDVVYRLLRLLNVI